MSEKYLDMDVKQHTGLYSLSRRSVDVFFAMAGSRGLPVDSI